MNNLCIIIGISFIAYLIFSNLNMNNLNFSNSSFSNSNFREGMTTDGSGNQSSTATTTNGVAGNAAGYAAQIKSQSIKIQDQLLITKYRSDYENTILNLDELVNNLMLQTALNVNQSNPKQSMIELSQLNQAKSALNNTMKFIDANK